MPDERQRQFIAAMAKVDAFIAEHAEYTREGLKQSVKGNTNQVVFAYRGDEPVVFKVFCTDERKERECFALRHWHTTGLVPDLIWDADPNMIIMSHVPGTFLGRGDVTDAEVVAGCFETGKAFGTLANVPWSQADQAILDSPLCGAWAHFDEEFEVVMKRSRETHVKNPVFSNDFWKESLEFMDVQGDTLLSQPRFLCHQDAVHFHFESGHFMGFFDLEMCFVGGEAMQLGFILRSLDGVWRNSKKRWLSFRKGWETATHRTLNQADLQAAVAAHQWRCWDQITGLDDEKYMMEYRNRIESISRMVLD